MVRFQETNNFLGPVLEVEQMVIMHRIKEVIITILEADHIIIMHRIW